MHILVVDDHAQNRYLLQFTLEAQGWRVSTAANGKEALEAARKEPPDLVISDILMPVMDGFSLCQRWREDEALRHIPFIFYTATYTDPKDEEFALSLGADRFVIKPQEPDVWPGLIQETLRTSHARYDRSVANADAEVLRTYNEVLIHKLEQKLVELEKSEAKLRSEVEERRRVEAALRDTETKLRLVIASADIGFLEWDLGTTRVQFSPEWTAQLGYSQDEISSEFAEWEKRIHPDDLPSLQPLLRQPSTDRPLQFEYRLRHKTGEYRWFDCHATILRDSAGVPQKMLASNLDITERRKSEQLLRESEARARAIADNTPVGIYMADVAGSILYSNRTLLDLCGSSSPILGDEWINFVDAADRPRVLSEWGRYIRGEAKSFSVEYRLIAKNGATRPVHEIAQPIQEGGRTLGFVGSIQDLSERRRAETERTQLESQLRQAQKLEAVGTLASGVAHDFNNILSAILGNVEMARFDLPGSHPVQQCLDEVKKASLRAQGLIRQILAFSRKQPVQKRTISLPPVIQEAASMLRAAAPKLVELRVHLDPDTPPVYADANQIHQVITNLCTNAWQAMEDRPGRIDVTARRVELDGSSTGDDLSLAPGVYACIEVSDTGKGIPPEHLDRIFEPFFTTKPMGRGTGLGLSVVHGIVRNHRGSIRVSSRPGEGATFTVYLPRASAEVDTTPPFLARTEEPLPQGNGQRILFLDDEEQLVFLAKRFLEKIGYRVTAFTRPSDAIEAVDRQPNEFHLAVTDHSMPEMSGIEVAQEWRRRSPALPVVLASGHVTDQLEAAAKAAGVAEVFYKPDSVEGLCRTIHRLANAQRV
jgi:PAS domain S-box-containing protein